MSSSMWVIVLNSDNVTVIFRHFSFHISWSKHDFVIRNLSSLLRHDFLFNMVDSLQSLIKNFNFRIFKEIGLYVVNFIFLNFTHFSNKHIFVLEFSIGRSRNYGDFTGETCSKSCCGTESSFWISYDNEVTRINNLIINYFSLLKRGNMYRQNSLNFLFPHSNWKRGDISHWRPFFNKSICDAVAWCTSRTYNFISQNNSFWQIGVIKSTKTTC